jgi:hypothetical protein
MSLNQTPQNNADVDIPLGIPFVGGSDDPSELVGAAKDGENSESSESGDPGV